MKRLSYVFFLSALCICSCVDVDLQEPAYDGMAIENSEVVLPNLTAGFEDDQTKTFVEEGKYLRWHADDRITAFFGNTLNRQYKFAGQTGDNSGSFVYVPSGNLETGNDVDRIYAVYPYNSTSKLDEYGHINVSLPAVQTYAEGSFGLGANTMVAITKNLEDTFLPFKNVCGYLKLKLYGVGSVKNIEVKGNLNEKIAGAAVVVPASGIAPELSMKDDATSVVTIDCGDGVELAASAAEAVEFWIVLPETTFEKGISITVETTDGNRYSKCTKKTVVVERNAVQPMAALSVPGDFFVEGANIVEYTAYEKLELMPDRQGYVTEFGNAKVISHVYDSRTYKGVIVCDKAVTSIGGSAFDGSRLISMVLPETVSSIGSYAFSECNDFMRLYLKSVVPPELTSYTMFSGAGRRTWRENVFVPAAAIDDYKQASYWKSITTWPYDYEKDYPAIPDDEIWYTSSSQEFPYDYEAFGSATLVSNTHEGYNGIFKFDRKVTEIDYHAFVTSRFTSLILPCGLTTIRDGAIVSDYDHLVSVFVPKSLHTLGYNSNNYQCFPFSSDNLREFVGGNVSEDGRCLFIGASLVDFASAGLAEEYIIPEGVKSIGMSAMVYTSLKRIIIPDSVTSIGANAFNGNTHLTDIKVPDNVTSIGWYAFSGCGLTEITLGAGVQSIGYQALTCSNLKTVYCMSPIPPKAYKGYYADWNLFGYVDDMIIYVPKGARAAYLYDEEWGQFNNKNNINIKEM